MSIYWDEFQLAAEPQFEAKEQHGKPGMKETLNPGEKLALIEFCLHTSGQEKALTLFCAGSSRDIVVHQYQNYQVQNVDIITGNTAKVKLGVGNSPSTELELREGQLYDPEKHVITSVEVSAKDFPWDKYLEYRKKLIDTARPPIKPKTMTNGPTQ